MSGGGALSARRHIVAVLLVVGCHAHLVSEPGGGRPSPYGPVNQASRGGMIKYRNRGLGVGHRKESAYRQMYDTCGGYYRIDAEGPRSEGGRIVSDGFGGVEVRSNEFWYIQFSCVPPPPPPYPPPGDYPSAAVYPSPTANPSPTDSLPPSYPSPADSPPPGPSPPVPLPPSGQPSP